MTGKTDEIEKAIFLRKFGVPFWAISYVFGKNAMSWYRKEKALGRNSIVGTTIKEPENIPKHIFNWRFYSLRSEKLSISWLGTNYN
jgi:hypothetical protein